MAGDTKKTNKKGHKGRHSATGILASNGRLLASNSRKVAFSHLSQIVTLSGRVHAAARRRTDGFGFAHALGLADAREGVEDVVGDPRARGELGVQIAA